MFLIISLFHSNFVDHMGFGFGFYCQMSPELPFGTYIRVSPLFLSKCPLICAWVGHMKEPTDRQK